ncbi:ComF family protein [Massilia violaceinigra]|uniref:ComF family protein n=1 Tax=Massilia violaceinigra TaxID=2045208 RepID=A0ABY4A1U2_9BURK|nr:ComF family protein [Massilia violaceinigra]UOD28029.1 ComF family protein [Massilia violaceinigra]
MQVDVLEIHGLWDCGFVLDRHSTRSTLTGHDAHGHPTFDTEYTEVGRALYALKSHDDYSQVPRLAKALHTHVIPLLPTIDCVVPMAPSKKRPRQPVSYVAAYLARMLNVPAHKTFLVKAAGSDSLKNLTTREEKDAALAGRLSLAHDLDGNGPFNVLLVDDLYETGASLDAACLVLRECEKIQPIYVAALTWRRPR